MVLWHNKLAMGRRRKKRRIGLRFERETILSAVAALLLLSAGLTFISFFAQAASVNFVIQNILNKLFGWGVILIPFILGLAGLVLLRTIKWKFVNLNTLFGLCLFTLAALATIHLLFFSGPAGLTQATRGEGGGLIGFYLQDTLKTAFSTPGALMILLCAFVLAGIIIFNASLDQTIIFIGKMAAAVWAFVQKFLLRGVIESIKNFKNKRAEKGEAAEEEKEMKVNGQEPEFQVVPSPAEPVRAPVVSPSKKGEEKKEEAVANVPFSDQVWEYPPLDLLSEKSEATANRGDVKANAALIEKTLASFGVRAKVVEVNLGPAVTQYALDSAEGTKIAKVTNLQNDLAMALASPTGSVRVEAPIPGKSLIGIEVPNYSPALVNLKSILTSDMMKNARSKLTVTLGLDVAGQPVLADIARMPHVLIAGATGSGKSILLHSFISTMLFRASPHEIKFILIDPKRVELPRYNGIPHLLTRVIVDPEKALPALKWAIAEMDRRYKLFESAGARDINAYNELSGFQALPYILIIVDELADLMILAPAEVEKTVTRLAQMSRATGLHLILATQRPSVDILTGLIKANIPCRIAFNVTSQVDSRVIIDQAGAEKLLGRGDMLYLPPDISKPIRIQGVFVSEPEISQLIGFLRETGVEPDYKEEVTEHVASKVSEEQEPEDELFAEAVRTVCEYDRASASLLQRRLRIGYARAARLLDELEERGIVGEKDGSHPRDVLIHDAEVVLGGNE
jgi:S-DNA-T family DNA segregation ATPase FtsK/SpoIIIE